MRSYGYILTLSSDRILSAYVTHFSSLVIGDRNKNMQLVQELDFSAYSSTVFFLFSFHCSVNPLQSKKRAQS